MKDYRKIWRDYYGEIPVDENGITFDIHHIDGNRKNNDISNLKAVSIKEHYEIHKAQGDWSACIIISSRLNLTLEEKLEINKNFSGENHPCKRPEVREKIKNNHADFKGEKHPQWGKKHSKERIEKQRNTTISRGSVRGEKNGMFGKGYLIAGEKHGMWSKNHSEEALNKMRGRKLSEEHINNLSIVAKSREKKVCNYCEKSFDPLNYNRWHGENCKNKNK